MNIENLSKEIKAKLIDKQQVAFVEAYNETESKGESEPACLRSGWTAAISINSRVVPHAFLFRPGNWDAAQGDGRITETMVEDAVFAINRCAELGVPIATKYMHSEDYEAIPVGITNNATIEDDHVAYGDVYILQDARADLDGNGSKILATINQMADALLTDGMKLSVEALYDVKVPSYYGNKTISLEPSAMAILPAGVAPAVTKKMIAGRNNRGRPVAFLANKKTLEGGGRMTLEELIKLVEGLIPRIDALEQGIAKKEADVEGDVAADVTELEKINAELKAKLDKIEKDKLEAEVNSLEKEIVDKIDADQKEKLEAAMKETTNLSEKKVVLSRLNAIIKEPADSERKLKAGRQTSIDKVRTIDNAIVKRMEETGESRLAASRAIRREMSESELDI